MLGAGSTSSPASGRILTVFEEQILAQVEKCCRWNVIDGRSYIVYGISEEGLKKFIPDGVLNSFKCFEEFAIRALDCHEPEKTRLCCKKLFHRDFVDASSVSGISLQNDEECEAFTILSDDSKRKTSEVLVGVNDRSSIVAGKKMIITNTSEQCVSPFSNDKGVLFKSRLGGKYIWLKCSESVLLNFDVENGKRIWKEIGKSMTHNVYFDVNPLSRQSGPVFQYTGDGKSLGINHERDGELFLPLHVIDTLLQRKIYSGNQKFVQWVCTNCDFQMKALFEIARITAEENNEGVLVCMVYEHLPVRTYARG